MKKLKVIGFALLALTVVVVTLLNNKAKIAARAKSDRMTSVPVRVATVENSVLDAELSLVGTIVGDKDVAVIAETIGRVTAVYVEVGDVVAKGAPLVQVDDEIRRANFLATEVNYEKTKKDLERFQALNSEKTISDTQLEQARLAYQAAEAQYIIARRQLDDTRIKSPIAGVVTARTVDVGTMVLDKMNVATVVDLGQLKLKVNVPEKEAFQLKTGDAAIVTTDVYPGITFTGRVKTISAKADEAHTYPVEVELSNSATHPLKSGMFGRVAFKTSSAGATPLIPREGLVGSVKNPQVYVVENGKARLRDVIVGGEAGRSVQILNGLKSGETIVTSGHNILVDGMAVTVIE
jgi:RND family efflux transporter MFP subunit